MIWWYIILRNIERIYFQDHISLKGSHRSKLVVHVVPTKTASMEDRAEETGVGGGGGGEEEEGAGGERRGEGEGEGGVVVGEEETDSGGAALPEVSFPETVCRSISH